MFFDLFFVILMVSDCGSELGTTTKSRRVVSIFLCQFKQIQHAILLSFVGVEGITLRSSCAIPFTLLSMAESGYRVLPRQRWSSTTNQLQMLENIFSQGNETPNKQKIKAISLELSEHSQVSETNVFNWFQNRGARSKSNQLAVSNTVSETWADCESFIEGKLKAETSPSEELVIMDDDSICEADVTSELLLSGSEWNQAQCMYQSNESW